MKVKFSKTMDKHAKPHSIAFNTESVDFAYNEVFINQNGYHVGVAAMIDGMWLVNSSFIGKGGNNRETAPKNPYSLIEVTP